MERMWLFHEDIELLQSLREQVERVCRGDSRKCMPIEKFEISGRTAKAVKLRISTLRQQLKSDVLVLDAAYLRDQTIYKNAAKTATLADAVAAVAAAKMKKAAAAREASVGRAQRAGKVAPLPWRRSAPGAQSVRLSYDTPTSLEYTHGPVPVGALINDVLRTAIIPPAWRLQIGTFDERIGTDLPAFAIEDKRTPSRTPTPTPLRARAGGSCARVIRIVRFSAQIMWPCRRRPSQPKFACTFAL